MKGTVSTDVAEKLLAVGRIIRPHGVKGELKVIPETDDPDRWHNVERLFIGAEASRCTRYDVESLRYQRTKKGLLVLVKPAGVNGLDEAMMLRKLHVFVHEDDLPPLEEGEFFVHELIDMSVQRPDGTAVGSVVDVLQHAAHDVLVIQLENGEEAMVPAIDPFVESVELESGLITIRPIEGMLDS